MKETTNQFPSEEVTLPSKGLLYPQDSPLSKGIIEMKYMTAREEDILTNQNLIENGTVIDKLLKSLIVTSIDYNDLLLGDKNAVLVAARILGYGKDYTFNFNGEEQDIDREIKGLKRINKNTSASLSTRMKYVITSVNSDYDTKTIRNFVDNQLLARDSRELRNYIAKIQPNVDLTFEYESKNGDLKKSTIPVGLNFFWPDAEL